MTNEIPSHAELVESLFRATKELSRQNEFRRLLDVTIQSYVGLKGTDYEEKALKALYVSSKVALDTYFPNNSYRKLFLENISEIDENFAQSDEKEFKMEAHCSFCGIIRQRSELGAGPTAFICRECINLLYEAMN